MLYTPTPICFEKTAEQDESLPAVFSCKDDPENEYVSGVLDQSVGVLRQGETKHFYSYGNFNSMRLIFHILRTTGPSNIILSTYGISPKSIESIIRRREAGEILDFRLILDNRVRSISPKPFDMVVRNFDYRCIAIHAKVACIYNENWKVTLVTSQNATDNPKIERGIIFTDPSVFDYDYRELKKIYDQGTT